MFATEASDCTTKGSENSSLAEAPGKHFNITILTMFKGLKQDMNKLFKEDHKNKQNPAE